MFLAAGLAAGEHVTVDGPVIGIVAARGVLSTLRIHPLLAEASCVLESRLPGQVQIYRNLTCHGNEGPDKQSKPRLLRIAAVARGRLAFPSGMVRN